ncbi:hypothetical protein VNO78_18456 [Psophocarpus tetragonolobus]|uniref:Uncharacterized protein n=1 Tax=Psophocarpus tetragonolobus TaxID=3891 RepID=A0AAN9XM23_PSOTE
MITSCFSQPNTNTASPSTSSYCSQQVPQNVVTCIYQSQLCNSPTYLTLSWSKTLFSHSLTISASDIFSITISLNSSFFRTCQGSKSIHHRKMKLHWNFTRAEFIQNSAEAESGFYLAISHSGKLQFFLGDLYRDLNRQHKKVEVKCKNTNGKGKLVDPVLVSRREEVWGSKSYVSRGVLMGAKHVIEIECSRGVLGVKVDGETRLVVKRLAWKFRGYEKIFIDGVQVEFYWDVLSWVVNSDNEHGVFVFVFQLGDGTVWPQMVGVHNKLTNKSVSDSSVLQWAEETGNCASTSPSSSTTPTSFSLLLYASTLNSFHSFLLS